jgi:hypothetical protein
MSQTVKPLPSLMNKSVQQLPSFMNQSLESRYTPPPQYNQTQYNQPQQSQSPQNIQKKRRYQESQFYDEADRYFKPNYSNLSGFVRSVPPGHELYVPGKTTLMQRPQSYNDELRGSTDSWDQHTLGTNAFPGGKKRNKNSKRKRTKKRRHLSKRFKKNNLKTRIRH